MITESLQIFRIPCNQMSVRTGLQSAIIMRLRLRFSCLLICIHEFLSALNQLRVACSNFTA